jgi:hypothetical protein
MLVSSTRIDSRALVHELPEVGKTALTAGSFEG